MELTPEILERISLLKAKYDAQGQDLTAYLDGLLYSNMPNYWDYVQVDTLLSLQKTYTDFPDEMVFLMYHQVTELYFKLCLHEFQQVSDRKNLDAAFFVEHVQRINRYFEALTKSFEIMVDGMQREQFLKFRLSLAPASGFQSAQYRKIEIHSTDFLQLVHKDHREKYSGKEPITELFENIYWKEGATDAETGKKTLTLTQFEDRYRTEFIQLGEQLRHDNLWQCYLRLSKEDQELPTVIHVLKQNDVNINVNWPLVHYKSAVRYLQKDKGDVAATGGTNWQKYLPPRFQKRIFYPQLWSDMEVAEWGKSWVEAVLN
ncbi:tryptophan 2,3-dioxygenase family protein [Fluviicola taffensis]|uniref:Tryptophan 2,3-dioxygenase apoenzyme n=1 Tax=Fluviicola taffensis (strain DSM 16823 / NCIMB 13979 / RW262) TaxID=755732 RepID=F2IGQ2_FLUTR|nr:tryptophan 2,3-dioxygenase family protein [Fluviicola taffensis]AEA43669.1 Tryptophan 2,3-dioxygenase apoenzyme [Fluviicola taffensis DSM 16823]